MNILSKWSKILAVSGLCAAITGCAIRPLPQQSAALRDFQLGPGEITPTTAIVRRIRCEARYAIARISMSYLSDELENIDNQVAAGNLSAYELETVKLMKNPDGEYSFNHIIRNLYLPKENKFKKRFVELAKSNNNNGDVTFTKEITTLLGFAKSGVGYEFEFGITEDNNANAGMLNFQFPRTNGAETLGFGGAYTRQRKNVRTFKVAETIKDIVGNGILQKLGCDEKNYDLKGYKQSDFHLPIYGHINVIDSFSTYAALILETNLKSDDLGFIEAGALKKLASRDLTDVITFTTKITGSADPRITITPLTSVSHITNAQIGLVNSREDIHKLTLVITPNGADTALEKLELDQLRNDANNLFLVDTN